MRAGCLRMEGCETDVCASNIPSMPTSDVIGCHARTHAPVPQHYFAPRLDLVAVRYFCSLNEEARLDGAHITDAPVCGAADFDGGGLRRPLSTSRQMLALLRAEKSAHDPYIDQGRVRKGWEGLKRAEQRDVVVLSLNLSGFSSTIELAVHGKRPFRYKTSTADQSTHASVERLKIVGDLARVPSSYLGRNPASRLLGCGKLTRRLGGRRRC